MHLILVLSTLYALHCQIIKTRVLLRISLCYTHAHTHGIHTYIHTYTYKLLYTCRTDRHTYIHIQTCTIAVLAIVVDRHDAVLSRSSSSSNSPAVNIFSPPRISTFCELLSNHNLSPRYLLLPSRLDMHKKDESR